MWRIGYGALFALCAVLWWDLLRHAVEILRQPAVWLALAVLALLVAALLLGTERRIRARTAVGAPDRPQGPPELRVVAGRDHPPADWTR